MDLKQFKKKHRRKLARKITKTMRNDVSYLLKPRPFFLPFRLWVLILSKFLYLDNNSIKHICSHSYLEKNKTQNPQTR